MSRHHPQALLGCLVMYRLEGNLVFGRVLETKLPDQPGRVRVKVIGKPHVDDVIDATHCQLIDRPRSQKQSYLYFQQRLRREQP